VRRRAGRATQHRETDDDALHRGSRLLGLWPQSYQE
jgi:hypothetical protein